MVFIETKIWSFSPEGICLGHRMSWIAITELVMFVFRFLMKVKLRPYRWANLTINILIDVAKSDRIFYRKVNISIYIQFGRKHVSLCYSEVILRYKASAYRIRIKGKYLALPTNWKLNWSLSDSLYPFEYKTPKIDKQAASNSTDWSPTVACNWPDTV